MLIIAATFRGRVRRFLLAISPPAARPVGTASLRHLLEEEEAVAVAVCAVGQPWPFPVRGGERAKRTRFSVCFLVVVYT